MRRLSRLSGEPKVLSPEEVEALGTRLRAFCMQRPIVLLYLHGTHARGAQGALSDLDLAVLLEPASALDPKLILDVQSELEAICRRDDVDLVVLNTAGPIIRDRVVRSGRIIHARTERERLLFEAGAVKAALDFQHFSRIYDDALFRQLSEGRFLD